MRAATLYRRKSPLSPGEMAEQLTATVAGTPLAALRATGVLERIAARVGR
ncbi:hypothetical protein ACGFSI_34735 [Streptomyces virginiae]